MSLARRLTQLYVGLLLYGLAGALQVRAGLGLDPWNALHQGLARLTGIPIGIVLIGVGLVVLLAWIPLRQRPGLGTLSNVVLVGLAMDGALAVLPDGAALGVRVGELVAGIVLLAVATGLYIGADLGPGPRDGLMTGLARRTGRPVGVIRAAIELSVLAIGWLLGGTVGFGTVGYALAIGPLVQVSLRAFAPRAVSTDEPLAVG